MAELWKLEAELTELRKAHRKLMQEAQASGATTVPDAIKVSAKRLRELEQQVREYATLRSSAPDTPGGAMADSVGPKRPDPD